MKLFVDTGGFIAAFNRSDQYHKITREYLQHLSGKEELFTSNYVIDEVITWLRMRIDHRTAVNFAEYVFESKILRVHYIDKDTESLAFKVFKKYSDKKFSFTDASSIAFLEHFRIRFVLGFDQEFKKLGYELLPENH